MRSARPSSTAALSLLRQTLVSPAPAPTPAPRAAVTLTLMGSQYVTSAFLGTVVSSVTAAALGSTVLLVAVCLVTAVGMQIPKALPSSAVLTPGTA